MTVGSPGVTNSLRNLLFDLSQSRNLVKVKIASTRYPVHEITQAFWEDDRISKSLRVIQIKQRSFLVQRLTLLPEKPKKPSRLQENGDGFLEEGL